MSDALLQVLVAGGRAGRLTHVRRLPARAAEVAPWPGWADADLVRGYRALGVTQPWTHQAVAAQAAREGRHTVLATSTGSGKSLAFWLPALTAVREAKRAGAGAGGSGSVGARAGADGAGSAGSRGGAGSAGAKGGAGGAPRHRIETVGRRAGVLYVCPTKALAADQLVALGALLAAAEVRDVHAETCDGDTPFQARKWIQDHADVVATNPDFLHFSLLANHRRWTRFLGSLRYVVVDEVHAYRGVFGAHVAAVLRRLRRLAASYGADPTFVLASATTAEPAVGAARLIGVGPQEVVAVTEDAAPHGTTTFALWQPPELPGQDPTVGAGEDGEETERAGSDRPEQVTQPAHRTATAEVADLLADLTLAGARTLAFTRSRRAAETVALTTRRHLDEVHPGLGEQVAAYRGGYLPEERRALEGAIRDGGLQALATTNALELGVDISGLDAVLIAGWPGTRASLWQQAGRAGRAGADGLVALVAREDPLDTYLVHHPEAVFDTPVEATVFDPTNPYVLGPHLCAAAAEAPLTVADCELFGPGTRDLLDVLVERGALRRRASGWYWTHAEPATSLTDLRGSGGAPVRVVEAETGRLLGTVDHAQADATVHPGAVYVHQGATYLVEELDLAESVALVRAGRVDYGTWAKWLTSVAIVDVRAERAAGAVTWGFGDVDVTSQVVFYTKRSLPGLEPIGGDVLDLPARTLPTTAVWWTAPAEVVAAAGVTADDLPGALHAAEHASIGLLPLLATCDRWDLGGVSTALHADTEQATVFVHDAYPGGAGFAERGFALGARWLRATRDAVAGCGCADGCPACVQSPKCGNQNSPLAKAAAVRLLDAVLDTDPAP